MYQLITEIDNEVLFEGSRHECEIILHSFIKYGIPSRKFYIVGI